MRIADLDRLIAAGKSAVRVEIIETSGSTPREIGAIMIVSSDNTFGTIGGGALEFRATEQAQRMLENGAAAAETMELPLGPEIGQCCGGRVVLSLGPGGRMMLENERRRLKRQHEKEPTVLIFGGGHVGIALARAFALLPFQTSIVETRQDILPADLPVTHEITPLPEQAARSAPPGAAIVVMTHDHALDYLIVSEALKRTDLAYIGLIGSKTKRATFERQWRRDGGAAEAMDRLICPIGGGDVDDKRPEIIAAMTAAEMMKRLLGRDRSQPS
ncbi:xanthine dehydrogenase accessory protein XdhC [Notoacmeibacter sp. MSK16QG-6]|uniref:xanthine dehydrogenase accessory protein XdhC n=1 Tax=Notoacmeibacter sp. MSK16QG-6 TaxID=2957982 RepID=UPI00209CB8BB|nr:xanthine dehydrogenase accessory protein XdhC [Notoacmeibacter sp. MSK16QG-6]MCP1199777.1 xanthine dehydrogenase accessory protein XdhC [Notoacmeibacter sp. MSK16QG-6]